jgi:hypothetical protein
MNYGLRDIVSPLLSYRQGLQKYKTECVPHIKTLNLIEITNKIRPCSRIYYSNVSYLLNMFRVTHRSSSGAQKL